ncbi:MAG: hypothetical protein ABJG68_08115 [Crocinitomicaceae bacterium]
MKIFLTLIIFLITQMGWSQGFDFEKKADSVAFNLDSTKVLVYTKNKTSLIDLKTGEYIVKKSKFHIEPFFDADRYLVFDESGFSVVIEGSNQVLKMDVWLNLDVAFEGKKLPDNRILFQFYDKLNAKAFTVNGYDRGIFQGSGLFNLSTQSWDIKPVYSRILIFENYFIAQKVKDASIIEDLTYDFPDVNCIEVTYDIYKLKDGKISLMGANIEAENKAWTAMFGKENIIQENEFKAVVQANSNYGLIKGKLFNCEDVQEVEPVFEWEIEPKNKFLRISDNKSFLALKTNEDSVKIHQLNPANDYYELLTGHSGDLQVQYNDYSTIAVIREGELEYLTDDFIRNPDISSFGLVQINDSLVKVVDNQFFESYAAHDIWGSDSIDDFGNLVYISEEPVLKTGIYNLKSHTWEMQPIYFDAYPANDKSWLFAEVEIPVDEKNQNPQYHAIYTFTGNGSHLMRSDMTASELLSDTSNLKKLMFGIEANHFQKAHESASFFTDESYYFKSDSKWGIVIPEMNFGKNLVNVVGPSDMVHVNASLEHTFIFDKGQFSLSLYDTTLIIKDPKSIELKRYNINNIERECAFVIVDLQDTLFSVLDRNNSCICEADSSKLNITYSNKSIIINDTYSSSYLLADPWGEYYENGHYEIEASSIWQKQNDFWTKISPYYAEIIPIKNGYIARTKYDSGEFLIGGGEGYVQVDEYGNTIKVNAAESRYILLDSMANPKSFLDFYDFNRIEDLDFGLKIFTDNGAFFANYQGKAITNDEWDDFELENGKLKATRYETFLLNEWGENEFDADGNPVYEQKGEIKWFDL